MKDSKMLTRAKENDRFNNTGCGIAYSHVMHCQSIRELIWFKCTFYK